MSVYAFMCMSVYVRVCVRMSVHMPICVCMRVCVFGGNLQIMEVGCLAEKIFNLPPHHNNVFYCNIQLYSILKNNK